MDEEKKFDPYNYDHKMLFALQREMEASVKALSDEDIYWAFWSNYESEGGSLENAIRNEYYARKLDRK